MARRAPGAHLPGTAGGASEESANMSTVPLHPALVHVPLGLSLVVPWVALGIGLAIRRGILPRRAVWVAAALQALVVASGLAAATAGDRDEERVERYVPEAALHRHEVRAQIFLWSSGATLAATVAVAALPVAIAPATVALAAAALVTAGAALFTGKAGGELVYVHGAAQAFAPGAAIPVTEREDRRGRHGREEVERD
jgi:uncharacterized membrane protein